MGVDLTQELTVIEVIASQGDQNSHLALRDDRLRNDVPVPVVGIEEPRAFLKRILEVTTLSKHDALHALVSERHCNLVCVTQIDACLPSENCHLTGANVDSAVVVDDHAEHDQSEDAED